jgi:hypothetical protein
MPIDPTPPGAGIMTATPEDKKLPQPKDTGNAQPEVEDEAADPVIDTGPGITDGPDTPVHP